MNKHDKFFFWCQGVEGGLVKKFVLTVFRQRKKVVKRPFFFFLSFFWLPFPNEKFTLLASPSPIMKNRYDMIDLTHCSVARSRGPFWGVHIR